MVRIKLTHVSYHSAGGWAGMWLSLATYSAAIFFGTGLHLDVCMMVPFKMPQVLMTLQEYMQIVELQKKCGSCAGFLIGLGQKFFSAVVDSQLLPMLNEMAIEDVNPRVMPSYAITLWFCLDVYKSLQLLQILDKVGLSCHRDGLVEFVATEILTTASRLQSIKGCSEITAPCSKQQVMGEFGMEIIKCTSELSKDKVSCCCKLS